MDSGFSDRNVEEVSIHLRFKYILLHDIQCNSHFARNDVIVPIKFLYHCNPCYEL